MVYLYHRERPRSRTIAVGKGAFDRRRCCAEFVKVFFSGRSDHRCSAQSGEMVARFQLQQQAPLAQVAQKTAEVQARSIGDHTEEDGFHPEDPEDC